MISLTGLGTTVGLKLVDATRETQLGQIARDALNARQIEAFRERVGDINSPAELIADPEVYTFVMRAFDLEDQIFGKALVRKMLESDITDTGSLVNRLTDPRLRELHRAFDFDPETGATANTLSERWKDDMVARFTERVLINNAAEGAEGVGIALEFKARVGKIETWFDVLKNRDTAQFMRTALGLPAEMVRLDVDKQAELFARKFDIEDLRDPEIVEGLTRKFSAIHDALNPPSQATSAALTLMQGAVRLGAGGFVPVVIDIAAIQRAGGASRYG